MYSMEFVEGVTASMWEGWNVCVGGWNKTVCVCGRGGIRLCVCVGGRGGIRLCVGARVELDC